MCKYNMVITTAMMHGSVLGGGSPRFALLYKKKDHFINLFRHGQIMDDAVRQTPQHEKKDSCSVMLFSSTE